ncbi:MAG: InlB B-repeat-containing protein, partial [Oscillospiraceae bacterium]
MKKFASFVLAVAIMLGSVPVNSFAGDINVVGEEQPTIIQEQPVVTDEQPVVTDEQPVVTDEQPVVTDEQPVVTDEQPVVNAEETTPQAAADPVALAAAAEIQIAIAINETTTVNYENGTGYQLKPEKIVEVKPSKDNKSLEIQPRKCGSTVLTVTIGSETLTYNIEVSSVAVECYILTPTSTTDKAPTTPILNESDSKFTKLAGGTNLIEWLDQMGKKGGLVAFNETNGSMSNHIEQPASEDEVIIDGKTYKYTDCEITWFKIDNSDKSQPAKAYGYVTKFVEKAGTQTPTGKTVPIKVYYYGDGPRYDMEQLTQTVIQGEKLQFEYNGAILTKDNLQDLVNECQTALKQKEPTYTSQYAYIQIYEVYNGGKSQHCLYSSGDIEYDKPEFLNMSDVVVGTDENLANVDIRIVFDVVPIVENGKIIFGDPKGVEDEKTIAAIKKLTDEFTANNSEIAKGEKIFDKLPTFDTIKDYTFDGWFVKDADGKETEITADYKMPGTDITLVPHFTKKVLVTVTFVAFDENNNKVDAKNMPTITNVPAGSKITIPTGIPTLDGYKFTGWFMKNEFDKLIKLTGEEIAPNNPIQIIAKFEKVSTVSISIRSISPINGNHTQHGDFVLVEVNSLLKDTWTKAYIDQKGAEILESSYKYANAHYSHFEVYTEQLDKDGKPIEHILVFDSSKNTEEEFNKIVLAHSSEVDLIYAKDKCKVNFTAVDEKGSSLQANGMPETQDFEIGNTFEKLLAITPTSDGYEFTGWYIDGKKIDETTKVPNLATAKIEAKFEKKANRIITSYSLPAGVKLTGNLPKEIVVNEGENLLSVLKNYDPQATVNGEKVFDFEGWYLVDEKGNETPITPNMTMPGNSIVVKAKFDTTKQIVINHIYNANRQNELNTLTMVKDKEYGTEINVSEAITENNNIQYILNSTEVKVDGKIVNSDSGKVKLNGRMEITYTYDADMINAKDVNSTTSDGIADKYQVVFTYATSNASQGTVTGTLKEVVNKQVIDKDGNVSYDEALTVKPTASIALTPADRYVLNNIISSDSRTFTTVNSLKAAEFSGDTTFTVEWKATMPTDPDADTDTKPGDKPNDKPNRPDPDDNKPNNRPSRPDPDDNKPNNKPSRPDPDDNRPNRPNTDDEKKPVIVEDEEVAQGPAPTVETDKTPVVVPTPE